NAIQLQSRAMEKLKVHASQRLAAAHGLEGQYRRLVLAMLAQATQFAKAIDEIAGWQDFHEARQLELGQCFVMLNPLPRGWGLRIQGHMSQFLKECAARGFHVPQEAAPPSSTL